MQIIVLKPFSIVTGSTTRNYGGTGVLTLQPGQIVDAHETVSWSSNVWITTPDGQRGKIECGEIKNLLSDGRAAPHS